MLEIIVEAAKIFCKDQLGIENVERKEFHSLKSGALVAYIDITMQDDERFRVYLAAEKEFVQFVASLFLEEENSDDETILDMAKECTNLIVGSAKVIGSKKDLEFTISTPKIKKVEQFTHTYEEGALLTCHQSHLFIALESIKG